MKNIAITKDMQSALTPSSVLQDLLEGNQRFIDGNSQAVDNGAAIGDVFVARVAGNFENADILGSLEYSCKVAGSKLVLVMGHEACGAVKAACDGVELGNITHLLSNILPAVKQSSDEVDGDLNSSNKTFVSKTVENNVRLTIDRIREKSPILKEMEDNGEIKIVGGVYSLHSGKVEML